MANGVRSAQAWKVDERSLLHNETQRNLLNELSLCRI
jgi:hypothetical protein